MPSTQSWIKALAGQIPMTAELYQNLFARERQPADGFDLNRLKGHLPSWTAAVADVRRGAEKTDLKRVVVFGYLHWWLEYATALALMLVAQGHEVTLAFLPYRRWTDEVAAFDLRRQRTYIQRVLAQAAPVLEYQDLSAVRPRRLPEALEQSLRQLSRTDVQYTLQREDVNLEEGSSDEALFTLRLRRNRTTAAGIFNLLNKGSFDAIVIPNGSILEFGAVYRTARHLGLPSITYEFGEQSGRMWLSQNDEVMRQDTKALWDARGSIPLADAERDELQSLLQARRGGKTWGNFGRQWQSGESHGAMGVRQVLGLDPDRPVVLLATNVVGDSLALNRQIFTDGMSDWLEHTVKYFAERSDAQLVVRVHPGELLGAGHPSIEIVQSSLPEMPEHVIVVPPESEINTYDLIELAHLGLVYTTTAGLEMALSGVPVITAGQTHYRSKGFTDDPLSLEEYLNLIGSRLGEPLGRRLEENQVDLAWRYAHRFFFEYPFRFPWHLLQFWDDIASHPLEEIIQSARVKPYLETLNVFTGEPIDWLKHGSE